MQGMTVNCVPRYWVFCLNVNFVPAQILITSRIQWSTQLCRLAVAMKKLWNAGFKSSAVVSIKQWFLCELMHSSVIDSNVIFFNDLASLKISLSNHHDWDLHGWFPVQNTNQKDDSRYSCYFWYKSIKIDELHGDKISALRRRHKERGTRHKDPTRTQHYPSTYCVWWRDGGLVKSGEFGQANQTSTSDS